MFDSLIGKAVGSILALLAVFGIGKEAVPTTAPTETHASDRTITTLLKDIFDGEDAPEERPRESTKETWDPTVAPARPSPQEMLRAARAMLPVVAPGIAAPNTSFRPIEKVKSALESGSLWSEVDHEEGTNIEAPVGEQLNTLFFGASEQEGLDDAWATSTLQLDTPKSIDTIEKELDTMSDSIRFDDDALLWLPEEDLLHGIQNIDAPPLDL